MDDDAVDILLAALVLAFYMAWGCSDTYIMAIHNRPILAFFVALICVGAMLFTAERLFRWTQNP